MSKRKFELVVPKELSIKTIKLQQKKIITGAQTINVLRYETLGKSKDGKISCISCMS
ncbi:17370_t:CDS:2 [Rhizophagus irregularis]|nr:17370_t:CDS:2 [Rhizophagus irregularis]